MAKKRSPLLVSAAYGIVCVILVAACGGKDEGPPTNTLPEENLGGAGGAGPILPITFPTGSACTDLGTVRECKIDLPPVNGVANCIIGVQVCAKTGAGAYEWSDCTDAEAVAATLNEMVNSGELTEEELAAVLAATGS